MWEVVRPLNSHVGRRYELCSARGAAAEGGRVRGAPWLAGEPRTSARAWQPRSPGPRGAMQARVPCSYRPNVGAKGCLRWPPVGAHCTHVATCLRVAHGCTWRARAVRGGRAAPEEGGARVCRILRCPREALELLTFATTEILLLAGVGGRAAHIHRVQNSRSGWAARLGCGRSCRAARSSATRPGTRTVWRAAQSEHKFTEFAQVMCGTMRPPLGWMI